MESQTQPDAGEILARTMAGESLDEVMNQEDNTDKQETALSPDETQASSEVEETQTPQEDVDEEPAETAKIDYDQAIPMPNREPMTLGEIKDLASKQLEAQGKAEVLSEQEKQNRLQTQALQRDLEGLAVTLQGEGLLTDDLIRKMQGINAQQKHLKARQTLTLIPEWNSPEAIEADVDLMAKWGEQYGIPREQFQEFADYQPNLAFAFRDIAKAYASVAEKLKNRKPPGQARKRKPLTAKQKQQARLKQAQTGTIEQKKEAMGAVLLDAMRK